MRICSPFLPLSACSLLLAFLLHPPETRGAQDSAAGSPQRPQTTYDPFGDAEQLDLSVKPISELTATIALPPGDLPANVAQRREAEVPTVFQPMGFSRPWLLQTYAWEASGLSHRPLYFEEPNVERRGYSAGLLQPAISAAHFFGRVPMLPYMMTVDPPNERIYEFGQPWPGTPGPFRSYWIPLDDCAGLVQIGVTVGLVYLIP